MMPTPLVSIVMENATHNAKTHGKKKGCVELKLRNNNGRLEFTLKNEAGLKHKQALDMQAIHGENMLLNEDGQSLDLGD